MATTDTITATEQLHDPTANQPSTAPSHLRDPTAASPRPTTTIHVTFTGGLELLFNNTRNHTIALPNHSTKQPTIAHLISHLCNTFHSSLPASRRALFSLDPDAEQDMQAEGHLQDGQGGGDGHDARRDADGNRRKGMTVRPGILVLVNDADWELEEERETVLEEGDEVVFVSTLHGG